MKKQQLIIAMLLVITGCVSKTLTGYDQGEIKEARQELKKTVSPEKLAVAFELKDDGDAEWLVVNVNNQQVIKEDWIDQYSKMASYETRCRGWRGATTFTGQINEYCEMDKLGFTISHLLLIGLIFDMEILFQEYGSPIKTTELVEGLISVPNSKTYKRSTPIKSENIELSFNGIKQSAPLIDGQASFEIEKLNIPSGFKLPNATVTLVFNNQKIDVSRDFDEFARSVVDAEQSRKDQIARDKDEKARLLFDQTCLELKHWPIFYTIVQKLNDHLYEMSGTGDAIGQRAILKTKTAIYDRAGTPANIRIQRIGVEKMPLKNGFSDFYTVWEECKIEPFECPINHPEFVCPRG